MKKFMLVLLSSSLCLLNAMNVSARDSREMYSLAEALETEAAKSKLDKGIRFYFGEQNHPAVLKRFGEFMSNKKTNAFNKTDKNACQWAFLSAIVF